jgi:hypothetical protein
MAVVVGTIAPTATLAGDGDAGQGANALISFRFEVLPLLTKAGCNSGTCHGTPSGKNGFRLSLRGYDAEADLATLTRGERGRRINPLDPDLSLLLLKATNQVPHEGGRRIDRSSDAYRILRTWIEQPSAPSASESIKLVGLEISPAEQLIGSSDHSQVGQGLPCRRAEQESSGNLRQGKPCPTTTRALRQAPQPLRVTARFDDGSRCDVTQLARFTTTDERVASVSSDGMVEKRGRGETFVAAEFCNEFATARIVFLEPVASFSWPEPPAHNFVDEHVFARLKLLSIEPARLATDEEFVRRIHLDLLGRLPTVAETRQFLADDRADKRLRLIDALLERPEFADWWALKWADRLGCNRRFAGKTGALKYQLWIRHAMAVNMPEDQFARAILTAGGPNYSSPAASFWRRLRVGAIVPDIDPLLAAEEISQLFLGVRIQCARCHNHPAERFTQDDFYGLAACFTRVRFKDGDTVNNRYDKEEAVFITRSGEIAHPRTGQPVPPRVLDGTALPAADGDDLRAAFADWLTAPDNRYFARNSVNRIWFHMFGRGLVEPVDDVRSSNPPSHPELLESLADDFVRHGFDRKHTIRAIANSRVYQSSSQAAATGDERYFSHARIRLLQSEQLLDAICQATEVAERYPDFPPGTPAVALADGEYKHPFLEAFGRPVRASACECERDASTNLSQALQLVSGPAVQQKVHSDAGRAARLAASPLSPDEVLDELFLATLCRHPRDEERRVLVGRLEQAGSDRRQAVEDVLWLLLNHPEFLFQH